MSWWAEKDRDRVDRRLARARARRAREERRRGRGLPERMEWEMDASWLALGEGSRMRRRMGW